jgi:hypothetical protein
MICVWGAMGAFAVAVGFLLLPGVVKGGDSPHRRAQLRLAIAIVAIGLGLLFVCFDDLRRRGAPDSDKPSRHGWNGGRRLTAEVQLALSRHSSEPYTKGLEARGEVSQQCPDAGTVGSPLRVGG